MFIAQHATATCCRGCILKWHRIEKGRVLEAAEVEFILASYEDLYKQSLPNIKAGG